MRLLCISITAFVILTGSAYSQQTADIEEAADAAEISQDIQHELVPILAILRGIAVVLLTLAIVFAGLAYTILGKAQMAIYVVGSAVVLFGLFWVVAMIIEPVSLGPMSLAPFGMGSEYADAYDAMPSSSGGSSLLAVPLREYMNKLLTLLGSATIPFIILYGSILSIAIAQNERYRESLGSFFLGSIICIVAAAVAQVFIASGAIADISSLEISLIQFVGGVRSVAMGLILLWIIIGGIAFALFGKSQITMNVIIATIFFFSLIWIILAFLS